MEDVLDKKIKFDIIRNVKRSSILLLFFAFFVFFVFLFKNIGFASEIYRYSFPDPPFLYHNVKAYQQVDTIYPGSIIQGQTLSFTVMGRDFQSSTTIEIVPKDGLTISNYSVEPPTKISFTLSASADATIGSRNLVVYNPTGSYEVYSAIYVVPASGINPVITSLNPSSGEAGQTYVLTIEGTNFDSSAEVKISGNSYLKYTYNVMSMTKIEGLLTIEANAPAGPYNVTVRNPDGGIGQRTFMVIAGQEGFKIVDTWPKIAEGGYPRGSVIQPFVIIGTGISSMAAVSFSDPNITYDSTKLTIDPNGKWIRIAELRIGENAALGLCLIVVTNPDGTTTSTGIMIKEKSEFLSIITNLAPVYGSNVTGFNLADGQPIVFKFMANKDINQASTYLISPAGVAQRTEFVNIVRGSSVAVQGASANDVRVFSISGAGVGKIQLPKVSDLGRDLGPGLYTLNLRVRATDGTEEMAKVKFVIRPQ